MANMSEDALFKALLKNKPQAQKPVAQQIPVRKEVQRPVAAPPAEIYEKKEPVIEKIPVKSIEPDLVVEQIKNLTASVNMTYGLIKTLIAPVMVLMLIVGILILVKLSGLGLK